MGPNESQTDRVWKSTVSGESSIIYLYFLEYPSNFDKILLLFF